MAIKHAKQSGLPADEGNAAHVEPTDWYADHVVTGGAPAVFIGCQIYNSSTQAIPTATQTPLTATTEVFDTDGFHDNSTNTSRLTIPAGLGGKYLVNANGFWHNNGGGNERTLFITVNNTTPYRGRDTRSPNSSVFKHANVSAVIDLAAGDYVEVRGYQDSGGNSDFYDFRATIVKLDSGRAGQGIGASVSGTSTALNNGSYTSMAFGAADTFDTDSFHDPSSNNTRLTIPAGLGGKYLLSGWIAYPNSSTSTDRRFAYRINAGTDVLVARSYYSLGSTTAEYVNGSVVLDLVAGDYVEVRGLVDVGSQTSSLYAAQLMRLDSGSGGPAWLAGDSRSYPSPTADNDEFEQNTSGVPSGWTAIPSGVPDTTDTSTRFSHLRIVRNANSGSGVFGVYKAYTPSFPFTWECLLNGVHLRGDFNAVGLFIAESGLTGKIVEVCLNHNGSTAGDPYVIVTRRAWTNRTTFSSGSTHAPVLSKPYSGPTWLRIVATSSTDFAFQISWDGNVWWDVETAFNPGFTVAAVGLSVHSQNATYRGEALFDYIRRVV